MKARGAAFLAGIQLLHSENRRQRALPECSGEHWGWITKRRDTVRILKDIASVAVRMSRPSYPNNICSRLIVELQCRIISKHYPFIPLTTQTLSIQVHPSLIPLMNSAPNREIASVVIQGPKEIHTQATHQSIRHVAPASHRHPGVNATTCSPRQKVQENKDVRRWDLH
jgi:hypothetical protein